MYKSKAKMLISEKKLLLPFWVAMIFVSLCYSLPIEAARLFNSNLISALLTLFIVFLWLPLNVGVAEYIMDKCNNKENDGFFETILFFNKEGRNNVSAAMFVTDLLIGLASMPFVICLFSVFFSVYSGTMEMLILAPLTIAAYGLIIWINIEWRFVSFILVDNPALKGSAARKISSNMVKGYRMEIFKLWLSFIPWYILSVLTLGLASLYVSPYVYITNIVMYKDLKRKYAQKMTRETPVVEPVMTSDTIIDVEPSDIIEVDVTHIIDTQTSEKINEY
jgi:hypothetical protein